MIYGIGTDLVTISRIAAMYERHGERALEKLLAENERAGCRTDPHPARYLAKRFAAKEALGKALGTGVREPVLLPNIGIVHDELGKPGFTFSPELADYLSQRGLIAHLSLTDEGDSAQAFVIVEQK